MVNKDKPKLNYRFHNPNSPEVLTPYLVKVFIEANQNKVERVIHEAALAESMDKRKQNTDVE